MKEKCNFLLIVEYQFPSKPMVISFDLNSILMSNMQLREKEDKE